MSASLTLETIDFKRENERIREALKKDCELELFNVCGQRYIGCGLAKGHLIIHGTPGNDMAAFGDGCDITVLGNAQDAIANTMNAGKIVVHGNAGDTVGYGMRGGEIYIKGNAGYRVGIHMKEYEQQKPVLVVGGRTGDFCGEYMAGGILILIGRDVEGETIGNYCATGMHGGVIYIHGNADPRKFSKDCIASEPNEADFEILKKYIGNYCELFGFDAKKLIQGKWTKLARRGNNPYKGYYVSNGN